MDLCNYNVINVNKPSGGVAVYVRSDFKVKVLSTSDGEAGKQEYIILEIQASNTKLLFSCIYRPPKRGHMDAFLSDLYMHIANYKYAIVAGDVNGQFETNEEYTKIISDIFELCNLTTMVPYGPTYHTKTSHYILDVIASNCQNLTRPQRATSLNQSNPRL